LTPRILIMCARTTASEPALQTGCGCGRIGALAFDIRALLIHHRACLAATAAGHYNRIPVRDRAAPGTMRNPPPSEESF